MDNAATPLEVFIVHWNQADECLATVNALRAQGIPLRITVIDNHSAPEAIASLKARLDQAVRFLPLNENRGWGAALNIVVREWVDARATRYAIISAHDVSLEPDCLARLVTTAESDPRVGIACPQYHDQMVVRFSNWRGVVPESALQQPIGTAQVVDAPHGTLLLLRRACIEEIGLFDERYFAYGDEHELGLRAARRGWKVVMVWGAIVINRGTSTSSALRNYLFARNSLLLVHDYRGRFSAWARALLILANALRLKLRAPRETFAIARWRGVRDFFSGRFGAAFRT